MNKSDEMLEFAVMQRMYEDDLWKNPNYYVGINDFFAHFFLNFSMTYSSIDDIEELMIAYDLKNITFLNDIEFVKWMHDISIKLINEGIRQHVISDIARNEYLSYIDKMYNKLKNILLQR